MKYLEFKKRTEELPLFETKELKLILGNQFNRSLLNNLSNWEKSNRLTKIRKSLYVSENSANVLNPFQLATKIYHPSYVSLETALGHYGIIPEAVFTTTSITTKKTKNFETNDFGKFSYQKIKKEAFDGFETFTKNNVSYKIAFPEKALIDFFYLNKNSMNGSFEQFQSFRFNQDFNYNKQKLLKFAKLFKNKKVLFLTNNFINYVTR